MQGKNSGYYKEKFLKTLKFHLSFYYNEMECDGIIRDYEEWFENETSQGKEENEIYSALEAPREIVRNLLVEFSSSSSRMSILLNHTIIQLLAIILLRLIVELVALKICNRNAFNYLYTAFVVNVLFYFLGINVFNKKMTGTESLYMKENVFVATIAILLILLQVFFVPYWDYVNGGIICSITIGVLVLSLFVFNLYYAVFKGNKDRWQTFLLIFHTSGVMSMAFVDVNQLHMLYDSRAKFIKLMYGSACIYVATVVLYFLAMRKKYTIHT